MIMDSLPPGPMLAVLALLFTGLGFFIGILSRNARHAAHRAEAPQPHNETGPGDDEQPNSRTSLLSGIHALDNITVNDILIPRSEVEGLNLDDPIEDLIEQLRQTTRTRLPVFHDDINQVEAILNTRHIQHMLPDASLTKEALLDVCHEPYFIPESTPLQLQLLNFHKQQRRLGVVVDEYGEVLGIVTLEDILEEIVGEFEDEQNIDNPHIDPLPDGRYVIDGAASIRELNKALGWHLPCDGPKTLNGLITEALENLPDSSVCLKIGPYRLEVLQLAEKLEGQLTVTLQIDPADHADVKRLIPVLERKAGRILANGFPTGVEVCHAMVHGGPFPSTSNAMFTSVGASAIDRFLRPVCYQDLPDALLPQAVQQANPLGLSRVVDGALEVR